MSRWRRIGLTVSAMLAVLVLTMGYRYVQSRGVFASVDDKTPGACRTVDGVSGVTAMAMDGNTALIATRLGGLYTFDNSALTRLSGTPKDFRPVAASIPLSHDKPSLQIVFARADGNSAVATFTFSQARVTETARLTTDQLTDPADLASLDGTRFYFVNHHTSRSAFGRWLDDVLLLPRAEVLFFDGMRFMTVAKRLNAPSSVALSPDGSLLYVAQEFQHTLATFKRTDFGGALGEVELFNLPAAPTRITMANDGSLIVAAWVKPGQGAVYRVRLENGTPKTSELLYAKKGLEVRAAAVFGQTLLVGTTNGLIACALGR